MRESRGRGPGSRILAGAAAIGLLCGFQCARLTDLHICGERTHRVARVRFSVDERWCAHGSGLRHGLYTAWHVTGNEGKRLEGHYEADRKTGTWRRWDDAGVLRWQGEYLAGAPVGLWTFWHPSGERWKRGAFRRGERDGLWTFWDRRGRVVAQVEYDAGTLVSEEAFAPAPPPHDLRTLSGVRWSFPLDCGTGRRPVVSGALAIAACGEASRAGAPVPARVYAVHLRTGREVWRRDLPPVKVSAPWSDGERVYLTAGEALLSLDAATGETRLRFEMEGKANAFSTAVRNGDVLYYADHRGLYALDLRTRALRWRYPTKRSANAPLVLAHGAVLARFWSTPGLLAIDASTGRRRWAFAPEGRSRGAVAADAERVYYGSGDHRLYALDRTSGAERWSFETGAPVHGSPALSGDFVLAPSNDGRLYALERATGRERWRFATRSMIEHAVHAVGGVVLVRSRDGRVYALDRDSGSELWRSDTATPWGSAPATGPGVVVFASDDGFLTALE